MRKLWIVLIGAACLTAYSMSFAAEQAAQANTTGTPAEICSANTPAEEPASRSFSGPEQVLESNTDYRAIFCTAAGPVYIDLFEDYAPVTVNNFVFLAETGYYNNTTFHRVIENFMAQGGDPDATGRGGPGYTFQDEFVGFLHFDRPGWLAMANGGPNTNGSQFFITTGTAGHLDNIHTIFGEVLEGQDIVESIDLRDPQSASEPGTSLDTIVIITDPAQVSSSFESQAGADEAAVSAALDSVTNSVPPDMGLTIENSDILTTQQYLDALPGEARGSYDDALTGHNHEYHASSAVVNEGCDLENFLFVDITYRLDHFATADDAAAALSDETWTAAMTADGFEVDAASSDNLVVYSKTDTACDTDVVTARASWQRGHFIATSEVTIPEAEAPEALNLLLTNFGGSIYERIFTDVLRPEIRQ